MKLQPLDKLMPALTLAQLSIGGVTKSSKNNHFNSNYCDINSLLDAIRVPLSENNLHLTQPIDVLDNGITVIQTILYHSSGQYLSSCMPLPPTDKPQAMGSIITYYRRYALMSLLSLPADDDDANVGERAMRYKEVAATIKQVSPPQHITEQQWNKLSSELVEHADIEAKLKAHCKLSNLKDVTHDQYNRAIAYISKAKELAISDNDTKK